MCCAYKAKGAAVPSALQCRNSIERFQLLPFLSEELAHTEDHVPDAWSTGIRRTQVRPGSSGVRQGRLLHLTIHTMRYLILLPLLNLLIGCHSSLVGTYRDDGVGRLHDALTLFPDSTYHYQYWADIPLGDEGQWSLNGDTLRLERSWGKDDQWLVRGKRLMIIDPMTREVGPWEFKRRSAQCDPLWYR